jgi:hypothetical protein
MKINTNYPQMTDKQLHDELEKRMLIVGETLPDKIDCTVGAIFKENNVFLLGVEGTNGLLISLPETHNNLDKSEYEWSNAYETLIAEITPEHPDFRDLLLQFLNSPFIFTGPIFINPHKEKVDQQEYLDEYDEDGFPIVESGPLEPIIDDDLNSNDYTLANGDVTE